MQIDQNVAVEILMHYLNNADIRTALLRAIMRSKLTHGKGTFS